MSGLKNNTKESIEKWNKLNKLRKEYGNLRTKQMKDECYEQMNKLDQELIEFKDPSLEYAL